MSPRPMIERVVRLESDLRNIKERQIEQHNQNRKSIHDLRNSDQEILDEVKEAKKDIGDINVKLAKYSVITGIATAIIVVIVEHVVTKLLN